MRSPPATGVRVCEKHQDFSDALGDRRIEEIQPPRFAGASQTQTRKDHERHSSPSPERTLCNPSPDASAGASWIPVRWSPLGRANPQSSR
ncbi:TPA: hypothetical protein L5632_001366 [Pseudomonas aeruginosa]|nr:hypothetical protein [Pseudomonas aeruginosa]